jgi:hypothetical protein
VIGVTSHITLESDKTGSTLTSQITIDTAENLYVYQLRINFDPSVLKIGSTEPTAEQTESSNLVFSEFKVLWHHIDNVNGCIEIAVMLPFGTREGVDVTSKKALAILYFSIIAAGDTKLSFDTEHVGSCLGDSGGAPLDYEIEFDVTLATTGQFDMFLVQYGRDATWMQLQAGGSRVSQGTIKIMVQPLKKEAVLHDPSFYENDWRKAYANAALAFGDQLVFDSKTWDVEEVLPYENATLGEAYYLAKIKTRRNAP